MTEKHSPATKAHDGPSPDSSREDIEDQHDASLDSDVECGQTSRTRSRRRARSVTDDLRRATSNVLSRCASRITTRDLPEAPPPPDGGLHAWLQVAMGWLVIFTTWGYVNSFGAFQTYYTSTLPVPASTVSWIGSIQVFLTLGIGVFSGRLLDAGLFLPTFMVGATIQVLGMFLMSIATEYWHLMLTQGVLTGIGGGIFFTPSLALVSTYFDKRRGLAIGLATTGNSAGGMIYPFVVRQLIPAIGFAWTARVLAFINLSCLAVVLIFMRPRLPPRKAGPAVDCSAFKEPVYAGFVAGLFFLMWANYYTFYYIASFGTEILNLPYSTASILVIILNGAGLPFRVLPPLVADRVGPINVLLPVALIWVVVAWCWLAVRSVPGYYVFTVFYGIVSGGFQCLIPTTVASITMHLDTVGTRLGMAFGIVSFAALTGPPLGGAIQADSGGSFTGSQVWASVATTVAFGLFVAVRLYRGGLDIKAIC
ncbi:Uu.00g139970.m01.CDS01 [Anthostomella pinea]|uniref:Uu.00g139970.m01.CDS01 n=1 Tax=Anthostomella pinea TaxID=933095 RepID=A0AAI8YIY0_9PEZI|nr:Uu.00g139970.m01.CDS01 [Anthostomella pinea]